MYVFTLAVALLCFVICYGHSAECVSACHGRQNGKYSMCGYGTGSYYVECTNGVWYGRHCQFFEVWNSNSRTCDVPYYYTDWILNCITKTTESITATTMMTTTEQSTTTGDCGIPPLTQNGYFMLASQDTTLGAMATLKCCNGFTTTQTITITCGSADWSSPGGTCALQDCGATPTVGDGAYVPLGTTVGSKAILSCIAGFAVTDPNTCIVCGSNGAWSMPESACDRDCGIPPLTQNGYFMLASQDTTIGAMATLKCCDGFTTTQTITITCGSADWSSPGGTCALQDCGATPTVGDGAYVPLGTTVGSKAILSCIAGFAVTDPNTCIVCGSNGAWSMPESACDRDCGIPPLTQNGYFMLASQDTTIGAMATLKCCDGFTMTQTITITCGSADWSSPGETCALQDCGATPTVGDGTYVPMGTTVGSKAILSCNAGFAVTDPNTCIVCGFNGSWSMPESACDLDCGIPPLAANGYFMLASQDTTLGANATLKCCDGFTTTQTITIACGPANWSSPGEMCTPIECPSEWMNPGDRRSCYFFGNTELYYSEAVTFCDKFDNGVNDSNLVQVDSVEELLYLKDFMLTRALQPVFGYWNDLFQATTNTNEVWRSSGDKLVALVDDWNAGEPNGHNESCTQFRESVGYEYNDLPCVNSVRDSEKNSRTNFVLCEINFLD